MIERLGTLSAQGDKRAVVHECVLAAKRAAVWDALTNPKKIGEWMQTTSAVFDHRVGGAADYRWANGERAKGTIMIFEPKEVIAFTWRERGTNSTVRFDLRPEGHATDLTLQHRDLTAEQLANTAAAWHAHLELLEAMLDGRTLAYAPRYQELLAQYEALARRI